MKKNYILNENYFKKKWYINYQYFSCKILFLSWKYDIENILIWEMLKYCHLWEKIMVLCRMHNSFNTLLTYVLISKNC